MRCLKVVTIVVLILGVVAIGMAQTSAAKAPDESGAVINTDTLLPIGLVVTLIGLVTTIAVNMSDAKNHRNDMEIHHSNGDLQSRFPDKSECKDKHDKIDAAFAVVNSRFDEVRSDLIEIKTILRGK